MANVRKMKTNQINVVCGHCGGSGRVEFAGAHADTLALLKKQKEPLSGAQLAKLANCKNEAMCNRLVYLEKHGLAKSTRYGRERHWTAL